MVQKNGLIGTDGKGAQQKRKSTASSLSKLAPIKNIPRSLLSKYTQRTSRLQRTVMFLRTAG